MTAMQRQRLNSIMSAIEYRQRLARRILFILAIAGIAFFAAVCLTSCTSGKSSEFPKLTEDERIAFQLLNQ